MTPLHSVSSLLVLVFGCVLGVALLIAALLYQYLIKHSRLPLYARVGMSPHPALFYALCLSLLTWISTHVSWQLQPDQHNQHATLIIQCTIFNGVAIFAECYLIAVFFRYSLMHSFFTIAPLDNSPFHPAPHSPSPDAPAAPAASSSSVASSPPAPSSPGTPSTTHSAPQQQIILHQQHAQQHDEDQQAIERSQSFSKSFLSKSREDDRENSVSRKGGGESPQLIGRCLASNSAPASPLSTPRNTDAALTLSPQAARVLPMNAQHSILASIVLMHTPVQDFSFLEQSAHSDTTKERENLMRKELKSRLQATNPKNQHLPKPTPRGLWFLKHRAYVQFPHSFSRVLLCCLVVLVCVSVGLSFVPSATDSSQRQATYMYTWYFYIFIASIVLHYTLITSALIYFYTRACDNHGILSNMRHITLLSLFCMVAWIIIHMTLSTRSLSSNSFPNDSLLYPADTMLALLAAFILMYYYVLSVVRKLYALVHPGYQATVMPTSTSLKSVLNHHISFSHFYKFVCSDMLTQSSCTPAHVLFYKKVQLYKLYYLSFTADANVGVKKNPNLDRILTRGVGKRRSLSSSPKRTGEAGPTTLKPHTGKQPSLSKRSSSFNLQATYHLATKVIEIYERFLKKSSIYYVELPSHISESLNKKMRIVEYVIEMKMLREREKENRRRERNGGGHRLPLSMVTMQQQPRNTSNIRSDNDMDFTNDLAKLSPLQLIIEIADMFNEAQKQIFEQMKELVYFRFIKSHEYEEMSAKLNHLHIPPAAHASVESPPQSSPRRNDDNAPPNRVLSLGRHKGVLRARSTDSQHSTKHAELIKSNSENNLKLPSSHSQPSSPTLQRPLSLQIVVDKNHPSPPPAFVGARSIVEDGDQLSDSRVHSPPGAADPLISPPPLTIAHIPSDSISPLPLQTRHFTSTTSNSAAPAPAPASPRSPVPSPPPPSELTLHDGVDLPQFIRTPPISPSSHAPSTLPFSSTHPKRASAHSITVNQPILLEATREINVRRNTLPVESDDQREKLWNSDVAIQIHEEQTSQPTKQ